MKGVLLTGHGGLEQLVYREDVEDPVPGPADVLLRVGAAGVDNTDVWTRDGAYGARDDPGKVQGRRREALSFRTFRAQTSSGRSPRSGPDVSPDRVGELVVVDPALYTVNGGRIAGGPETRRVASPRALGSLCRGLLGCRGRRGPRIGRGRDLRFPSSGTPV